MDYIIVDSPPGANCPMVEAVQGSDYVILVTEPTLFGLYDLKIAWDVIKKLNIPSGVVINRSEGDDDIITKFAYEENLPVILKIPFSREFAMDYSIGEIKDNFFPDLKNEVYKFIEKLK